MQFLQNCFGIVRWYYRDHPDAAVESPVHLLLFHVAVVLQPFEHLRHLPAAGVDHAAGIVRQHARQIFQQSTTGDVRERMDRVTVENVLQGLNVDLCRSQQGIGEGYTVAFPGKVLPADLDDLAYQGITVGVRSAGGERNQYITWRHLAAINCAVFLDDADAETGKIIISGLVHAGHFRGLTTDQGRTGLSAALGDTLDDIGGSVDIQCTGGVIIQKEQRFRTQHQDIVDTHGDKVDADGVMSAQLDREFEFCADAVRARYQQRLFVAVQRKFEQPAKSAEAAGYTGPVRARDTALDAFDQGVAGIDINTGIPITQWFLLLVLRHKYSEGVQVWYCTRSQLSKRVISGLNIAPMKIISLAATARQSLAAAGLLLLQFVMLPHAGAVVVENLFDVEFPVPNQSSQIRNAVFSKGLEEVLIRVSGRRSVIQELTPGNAAAYVQQYSYVENDAEEDQGAGQKSFELTYILRVQYNAGKIINLLRENGQPVWGERRGETIIWLAVRDGSNRYVLKKSDASLLRDSAEQSANRRGLPLIWPVYDRKDRQKLGFTDVWAAFREPVRAASKRYTVGPSIVGRLSWTGNEWKGDWSVFVDNSSYSWSLSGSDYNSVIAEGIDLSADKIGKHYSVLERVGSDEPGLLVEINNVDSVQTYRKIQTFLEGLAAVRQTRLARVEDGVVLFRIDLRGDIDDFVRLVATDRTLEPLVNTVQPGGPGQQTVLYYSYRR